MTVVAAKWSIEEYHQLIATGVLAERRVELLQGLIIDMTPEGVSHAANASRTTKYLARLLLDRAEIRDGHPITLPNNSEPEPDIAIVRCPDTIYDEHHPYPEDIFWLIEYSDSTLSKDLGAKRDVYAAAGIQEYWVVNLQESCLIVFRNLMGDRYQEELRLDSGSIDPVAFPDLLIDVRRLFSV
jgi:Uma2 family endonuclease